jgi:hypothetical protein
MDARSFSSPEYHYHYPFGAPLDMECANDAVPRQNPPISNCFVSPEFMDCSQRMMGDNFTPLPSPEHSLSGYEQTQDPASRHFFHAMSNYSLYHESASLSMANDHGHDQVIVWDALVNEVPLGQVMEHPPYFGDVTTMTPTSVSHS